MIKVIKSAVLDHQLTLLRDKNSNSQLFRACIKSISQFMCYEVTKDLLTKKVIVETPICKTNGKKLAEHIVLVPILRAGLGIVDAFREMIPRARIGHIGIYRNKNTKKPIQYYCKMPTTIKGATVILLDPMLATGYSASHAISIIKKYQPRQIKFVCIIATPVGIKYIQTHHKDVQCYTIAIDKKLDNNKYIVPGCGDAGDRIFGTK